MLSLGVYEGDDVLMRSMYGAYDGWAIDRPVKYHLRSVGGWKVGSSTNAGGCIA